MSDVQSIVDRVFREVKGQRRERFNKLQSEIDDSTTSLTLAQATGESLSAGTYLGIGSEILYVWSVDGATATVERGMFGTTAATHAASSLIEINWRWFTADVLDHLADEILSWPPTIYGEGTLDVAATRHVQALEVSPTRFRHILEARQVVSGYTRMPTVDVEIVENLPTDQFSTNTALFIKSHYDSGSIRVVYAQGFDVANIRTLTTTKAAIGLTETLVDVAIYGTAARLLNSDAPKRSSLGAQPEPRNSEEVGPLDAARIAQNFQQIRDRRLSEEESRLRHKYPVRFRP